MLKTGALIVAAGMSSRMGDFNPLLRIGSHSISQRIVSTFKEAGITCIVMITGYRAADLEKHLEGQGVLFLRNEAYQHSDMFASARIGFSFLHSQCDRILFTPVYVPLFTADTIRKLLETDAEIACPVCGQTKGHPILLSSEAAARLSEDSGENGLRGAISRCHIEMQTIQVEDKGILYDADTPADYASLLRHYDSQFPLR